MDARIEEVVLALMEPWRKAIGRFVADVVRGWETRTVVDRAVLAVGPDLPYLRGNGTLVGAVVGFLLFFLSGFLLWLLHLPTSQVNKHCIIGFFICIYSS